MIELSCTRSMADLGLEVLKERPIVFEHIAHQISNSREAIRCAASIDGS